MIEVLVCVQHEKILAEQCRNKSLRIKKKINSIMRRHPNPYYKKLAWWIAGCIPLLAILSASISLSLSALLVIVIVLLGLAAAITRAIQIGINLSESAIRKIWKTFAFTWHRTYALAGDETVEVKYNGRIIEGYSLRYFIVQLAGKNKAITLYSTDDTEEARAVQEEITAFLKKSDVSTQ